MATSDQLEYLRNALSFDRPPLCSGAISSPPEGLHLWYDKKNPKFIDFATATPEDLDLLVAACDPATFGRGSEDVYDETYRKAVKMDASNFAVHLDLAGFDLIQIIEDRLLQPETENKRIKAELYKLNVYSKDSFFKAHTDTPRGTNMLGSLVVIYPTAHEGGELVLRHKGHEFKFDANSMTSLQPSPSLAYVAFYSDLEHEVLKVTSGHRVTITYNLYLVDSASKPGTSTTTPDSKSASNLQHALQALLETPEFLPDGGLLGFGLAHLYPVSPETKLSEMADYLKGEDAHVYQVCRELQLRPSLYMIYDDDYYGSSKYGLMLNQIVSDLTYDYENSSYEGNLMECGAVVVNKAEDDVPDRSLRVLENDSEGEFITWVSPFNQRIKLRDTVAAYGNEVTLRYSYCSPSIIAHVAPASDRVRVLWY